MRLQPRRSEDPDLNLTPLIDVVFLLLIFFMVSTTFTRETRLGIILPEASGVPQLQEQEAIEIVISADGSYLVNGERLARSDRDTLRSVLLRIAPDGEERPLMITADAQSSHRSVVEVMDVVGRLGFTNLSITTREPGTE